MQSARKKYISSTDVAASLTDLTVAKTLKRVNAKKLLFSRLRVHFRTYMLLILAISII